jgi:hypothetical protein
VVVEVAAAVPPLLLRRPLHQLPRKLPRPRHLSPRRRRCLSIFSVKRIQNQFLLEKTEAF